jgi:hypothetical protein
VAGADGVDVDGDGRGRGDVGDQVEPVGLAGLGEPAHRMATPPCRANAAPADRGSTAPPPPPRCPRRDRGAGPPRRQAPMKSVRLHNTNNAPSSSRSPNRRSPARWRRSCGSAAPACAAPTCTSSRASGPTAPASPCPTLSATKRRLGPPGRLRGHQPGPGRHRDPAPAGHLRAVPGLPLRRRHALRPGTLPRHRLRRRHGPTAQDRRASASNSTRRCNPPTSPRSPTPG